ncbi:MAG: hypothetical protein ACYCXZ_04205 [Coriobacteriia bacterium]
MDKLDRILHAEDVARDVVDDARLAASRLLAESRDTVGEIRRSGRDRASAEAVTLRAERLEKARREAAHITEQARAAAATTLDEARAREDDALAAVLGVLKGR